MTLQLLYKTKSMIFPVQSMATQTKLVSFLLFFLLSPLASSSSSFSPLFESWCSKYNKTYASEEEKLARFRVFEQNAAFVEAHNSAADKGYSVELNGFADLTANEFRSARLGLAAQSIAQPSGRTVFNGFGAEFKIPDSLDWRDQGAVTKVKDQGSCGACWSFSATGAIEGINKIVTGSLVSVSEQELIDCDRSYNMGCNGGLMDYAYKWVIKNDGIDSESDYPYKAKDGSCNNNKVKNRVVTIDGYTDILPNREDLLLQAVATQPISVGICGSASGFQLYSKGIFTGPCSTSLDHAVLIVGYGSSDDQDYWIVKNSWGSSWGMDGYILMQRNANNSNGLCGINMMPSYPIKTGPNPPPGPGPTKCGIITYCEGGGTCCCRWKLFGVCLSWGCCGLESAVCCEGGKYCCPSSYPVCDVSDKQCLKGNGNMTGVGAIERKGSFVKAGWWNDLLQI
ncbi:hypothetical protein LUZ60_005297 [Juncus effusus]|nr:hypothetical protein LUZ60_005297 [Juncus effusus]